MKLKKLLVISVLLICFMVLAISPAYGGNKIRYSTDTAAIPDLPVHAFALTFEYFLEANTDIEVDLYPGGILGGTEAVMEQVQEGDIHVAHTSISGLGHYYPKAMMFNLWYAFPLDNIPAIQAFFDPKSDYMQELFADIEEKTSVKPMRMAMRGGESGLTFKQPVRTLEDMKGLTMRAMDESQVVLMESLGASTAVVPWEEVYLALQTGVVDGLLIGASSAISASLYEVVDYYLYPGTILAWGMMIVNPDWYNTLTEEEQYWVNYAMHMASVVAEGLAFSGLRDDPGRLEERGLEVYRQTEKEYNEFRETALGELIPWANEKHGEEFVDRFMSELKKLEEEYGLK